MWTWEQKANMKLTCLGQPSWPKSKATDDIATEAANLVKKGIEAPFVFCELNDLLPFRVEFKDAEIVESDGDEDMSRACKAMASALEEKFGSTDTPTKSLDVVRWNVAFDKYTLASETVDHQLSYTSAPAHKEICMQVGLGASFNGFGRRASIAPTYDKVCKRN